jgi:excinuclease ABC subunit C
LLKQFGSLEAIRAASVDELSAVPGMTRRAAEQVKKAL